MRDHQPVQTDSLLARIPLFEGLSQEELQRVNKGTREVRLGKHDMLFQRGDKCSGLYLVIFGQIKLAFTSLQGTDKVIEVMEAGESFGESFMFLDRPYPYYAQALADSLLLHVSRAVIDHELENDHLFMRKMLANMARQLRDVVGDVESYSLHNGERRVIGYLMQQLDASQFEADDVTIELPTIKGVIASRINLTHEHFSRILHALNERQLLTVKGRKVHIPSVAKLIAAGENA